MVSIGARRRANYNVFEHARLRPAGSEEVTPTARGQWMGAVLRVGVFVFIAVAGSYLFPWFMVLAGAPVLVLAALGTFAAAAVANAVSLRIYERAQLSDIGLGWTAASRRNLALGMLGGIGAGIAVVALPLIFQAGYLEAEPNARMQWGSLIFVSIVLLFGAAGEEMLFRGYGFQVLVRTLGPFGAILPTAVLFAFAHSANLNFTGMAFLNTLLWGVLLGWAFVRSGDLWLPIGLHFGWNWVLPLLGVNLSGFTMGVTGYSMHWTIGALWSGGSYGPEGGLFASAIVALLFYYIHKAPIQPQDAFLLRPQDK